MEAERGVREAGLSSLADGVDVESGGERNSGSRLDSWSCVLDIVNWGRGVGEDTAKMDDSGAQESLEVHSCRGVAASLGLGKWAKALGIPYCRGPQPPVPNT